MSRWEGWARWVLGGVGAWLLLGLLATGGAGPPRGAPAPALALPDPTRDTVVRLDDLRGTPVVIDFVASWCPACRVGQPAMSRLAERLGGSTRFVAVSVDGTREEARALRAAWKVPYPVLFDGDDVAARWGVTRLPTVVIVDQVGVVRDVIVGAEADDVERGLARLSAR